MHHNNLNQYLILMLLLTGSKFIRKSTTNGSRFITVASFQFQTNTNNIAFLSKKSCEHNNNTPKNQIRFSSMNNNKNYLSSSSIIRQSSSLSSSSTREEESNNTEEETFESIGIKNKNLLKHLSKNNINTPSIIQSQSYSKIISQSKDNIIIGSETGSGKTLAYLLPLFDDILSRKESSKDGELGYEYCRAIILVPNKELAQQVLRMSVDICGGVCVDSSYTSPKNNNDNDKDKAVRLSIIPGGLYSPFDYKLFREALYKASPQVDIVITTPNSISKWGISLKYIEFFSNIPTLVIDEADMLLDGGYIQALNMIFTGFKRADKAIRRLKQDEENADTRLKTTQHIFVAATLPNSGLKSCYAYLEKKFPNSVKIFMKNFHNAKHTGLNIDNPTTWIKINDLKERLDVVIEKLGDGGELKDEKVMVFINTAIDVDQVTDILKRSNINALPYHAKINLQERMNNLSQFRDYEPNNTSSSSSPPPVLVCTDLASRGIDIPKVTIIIQLQFASNVITHLHRMGRCGRILQTKERGRGIIFYGDYEKDLVDVILDAEEKQEGMVLEKDVIDLDEDDEDEDEDKNKEDNKDTGKVTKAFSRRRGFRKKIKKEANAARDMEEAKAAEM